MPSDDMVVRRSSTKQREPEGLAGAVKHVVKFFLEKEHYSNMARLLSEQWSNSHSLTAAVRLMEAHGVKITPDEEARLAMLPEDRMIDAFVCKMPQQDLEQFEYFFVQLSLICSSTTRLRQALDEGDSATIEDILEGAESTGILSYMLKMFVSQAGSDCKQKEEAHAAWLEEARAMLKPLLHSQSTSMVIHKALADARARFGYVRQESSAKSKKVLGALCSKANGAFQGSVFTEWVAIVRQAKRENNVMKEYEEELEAANKRLLDYREQQTANIRNVINSGAARDNIALVDTCFRIFVEDVIERKQDEEMKGNVAALEERMKNFAEDASANAKKVLASISAGDDDSLKHMCFGGWKRFHENYQQDKEMEDAVKAAEQRLKEFEKKQKSDATGVLGRMQASSESGMLAAYFKAWKEHCNDEKAAANFADTVAQKGGSLDEFKGRAKGAAMKEMLRMTMCADEGLQLAVFMAWKKEHKVEGMKRLAREKNAKKKTQLIGVKNLFKNFASELDAGLKEGTPRQFPPARSGPRSGRSRNHSGHSSTRAPLQQPQAPPADAPREAVAEQEMTEDAFMDGGSPSGPEMAE